MAQTSEKTELDGRVQRLAVEGVVVEDDSQRHEGVFPFLWKMAELEHLSYTGKKRDRLRRLADEIHQLAEQWQTDYPPLFAVTGLKNAGKSSLVKTFLSDEGRARTPTGIESDFATRRYVFWLPESLRSSGKSGNFESMLTDVFGNEPECLSSDPEIANQQYREDLGFKGMRCPLIAYDSNLDGWNTGIVDCPDIETGDGKDNEKLSSAKEMLEKVSRLCAAFLILGQHENLERDVFWQIVRMVQEVGKKKDNFLVVNKCPPKPSTELCNELENLASRNNVGIDGIHLFASYNFKSRGAERFCVTVSDGQLPMGSAVGDDDLDALDVLLPTFFSCNGSGPYPPDAIPHSHLLQAKVQTLPSDDLRRQFQAQMSQDLQASVRKARKEIDTAADKTHQLIVDAYKDITRCFLDAMTKDDSVTPLQNPKLAERQMDLLIDEAPPTIKVSMKISKGIRSALMAGANAVVPKAVRTFFDSATSMLRRQGVELDSDSIARSMAIQSAFARVLGSEIKNSELAGWLTATFNDFLAEFDCEVEYLRPLVREHYENMSLWGKVKAHGAALTTIALLVVAAVFAPIDGGGSLWGVSMLEGFLIAGGASAADLLQAGFNIRKAEKPLIEGQLSFLTAGVASRAGLPSIESLDESIEVKGNRIKYQLQTPAAPPKAMMSSLVMFRTHEEVFTSILEQLHNFYQSTTQTREGDA
jgi:hypothetical protein